MKMRIMGILILLLVSIHIATAVDYPSPTGYVNDFAKMLSSDNVTRLNNEITAIEKDTTVEIAIVTVDSLQGVSVEEYAVKLFEKWGIGKKGKDNGLLILVSKNDREYRIETGYGLEGTINAARAGRIGRFILEPNFKKGEYGQGLYEAVLEIRALVENEPSIVSRNIIRTDAGTNQIRSPNIFTLQGLVVLISLLIAIIGNYLSKRFKYNQTFNMPIKGNYVSIDEHMKYYEKKVMEIRDNKKKRWILLLGGNSIAIIAIYLVAGFGFVYIAFIILIFLMLITGAVEGESGGGDFEGGHSGGGGFGGGSSGGGFGGGSSGGGGNSGKW